MKVGFIGLGIMGSRMANNMQAKGQNLVVYNRSRDKAEDLLAKGATWADSPAAVASQVDILFTMLADPNAVKSAALGENGFLSNMAPNSLWVDCSTVNPAFSREMAQAAQQHQVSFLDAPVAGSKKPAASAELIFMVGGQKADLEKCESLLNMMGHRVVHVGENGMGTSLKMVANMMLGVSMVVFAEGMALGQSLGLNEKMLLSTFVGGPVVAPFVAGKQANFESGNYEPEFPLQWMQKDLQLANLTAYEVGAPSLLTSVAKEVYGLSLKEGFAEKDFSAIYQYLTASSKKE